MSAPVFVVRRVHKGVLVKTYGPFRERDEAERVALASIQKHMDATVIVESAVVHPHKVKR